MQSLSKYVDLFCFLLIFSFSQCKKGNNSKTPLNLTLYDKPLSVIRQNILGYWQLQYEKGGICSTCINRADSSYFDFGPNDKVKITNKYFVSSDTTITWINEPGIYTNGANTFTMNFYDKRDYPINFIVDKIINDTLVLHDFAVDAVYYYLLKKK